MVADFSTILPRLSDILEATTLDGDSGRTISAPKDYPQSLNSDSLPLFINRVTGARRTNQSRQQRDWLISVTMTLYLRLVGTGVNIASQYDLYGYWNTLDDLFGESKSRLEDSSRNPLTGVNGIVVLSSIPEIPTIRPYPLNVPEAPRYWAAEFVLDIPFQKLC